MGSRIGRSGPKKKRLPNQKNAVKKIDVNEMAPEGESEFHKNRRVVPYALRQFYFGGK